MKGRTEVVLEHMLENARDVVTFAEEAGSFKVFSEDVKTRKAVIMSLLNIGELANHLPKDFTDAYPDIPWRKMIGMRNLVAHGYHTLNLDVVWDTTQTTIFDLLEFLQKYFTDKQ